MCNGAYFNRDGFCFAFAVTAMDGIAFMDPTFRTIVVHFLLSLLVVQVETP